MKQCGRGQEVVIRTNGRWYSWLPSSQYLPPSNSLWPGLSLIVLAITQCQSSSILSSSCLLSMYNLTHFLIVSCPRTWCPIMQNPFLVSRPTANWLSPPGCSIPNLTYIIDQLIAFPPSTQSLLFPLHNPRSSPYTYQSKTESLGFFLDLPHCHGIKISPSHW